MLATIRILVCDDQPLIRAGLQSVLREHPDLEIVGEAVDGRECLAKVARTHPHVVLMDVEMPGLDGIEATRRLRLTEPDTRILVLSAHREDHLVARALGAGAAGYVVKDAPLSELVEAVRAVARGGRCLSSAVLETMVGIPPGAAPVRSRYELLTDREREVLKLVADGLSVKEIAARLGRTVKTAEVHKHNLARKLGLHRPADLVKYAIAHGLIQAPIAHPPAARS